MTDQKHRICARRVSVSMVLYLEKRPTSNDLIGAYIAAIIENTQSEFWNDIVIIGPHFDCCKFLHTPSLHFILFALPTTPETCIN